MYSYEESKNKKMEIDILDYLLLFLKKIFRKKKKKKRHSKHQEFKEEIFGFKKLERNEIIHFCRYFTECKSPIGAYVNKKEGIKELDFFKNDKKDYLKKLTKHYIY